MGRHSTAWQSTPDSKVHNDDSVLRALPNHLSTCSCVITTGDTPKIVQGCHKISGLQLDDARLDQLGAEPRSCRSRGTARQVLVPSIATKTARECEETNSSKDGLSAHLSALVLSLG